MTTVFEEQPLAKGNCAFADLRYDKGDSISPSTLINRAGEAGAVLQTASSLHDLLGQSVSEPFPQNLHNIINHKQ